MSIFSRLFERKNNLTVSSDIKKKDARSRNIAFVDTEVGLKDHKIHDIGALRYDGATFHQASQTALNKFLQEGKVDYICGHNLIHHDARYLQLNGILIDTLYLSPLLFPKRPYHHLVKDDKLMSEQMNNPVNDCEKAKELLMDEIAAWNQLSERKRKIFTLLLQHEEEFKGFLMYVGAIDTDYTISDNAISADTISDHAIIEVSEFIHSEYKNHICAHADIPALAAQSPCGWHTPWPHRHKRLPICNPRLGTLPLSRSRTYHLYALPYPMHRWLRVLQPHARHSSQPETALWL